MTILLYGHPDRSGGNWYTILHVHTIKRMKYNESKVFLISISINFRQKTLKTNLILNSTF